MSDANVSIAQDMYAAFQRGDIATILAALTSDIHWQSGGAKEDYPVFGSWNGTDGVRQFFRLVAENLDFSEFSPQEYVTGKDKVIVLGRYAMTMRKTGKKFSSDWAHVFTFQNGKVAAFREYTDTGTFLKAYRES